MLSFHRIAFRKQISVRPSPTYGVRKVWPSNQYHWPSRQYQPVTFALEFRFVFALMLALAFASVLFRPR